MAAHLPSVAGVLSGAGVLLLSLDVRHVPAVSDVAVDSAVADILAAVASLESLLLTVPLILPASLQLPAFLIFQASLQLQETCRRPSF
jgi:hypothetical protein